MDHKDQHHQKHIKEREHEKKEHKKHEQEEQGKKPLSFLPVWVAVGGVVLVLVAMLIWMLFFY